MIGVLAFAVMSEAAISREMARAPRDVRVFIERRESCDHWAGEEPYDADRRREIEAALRADRCDTLERDERRVRRRHADSPTLLKLLRVTKDGYE